MNMCNPGLLSVFAGNAWLRAQLLGVVAVLFSVQAFAGEFADPEQITEMFVQSESVSDADLSRISGRNNATVLDAQRVAVILWDERGGGSRRDAVNLMQRSPEHGNTHGCTLTVTRN